MTQTEELIQALSDAYDETPYESNAFPLTAPGHLRAVAALYGLSAPPVENARILELGCAAGGNLLPFAVAHPNAHVVGIDLSTHQIESGQTIIKALGLANVELRSLSITDISKDFGEFDYIIAHGVFSWVPPPVREAILRVCRENLAPEGIAYISYNTYPGWKASDVVRDAMILNSYGAQTPTERVTRAKDVLGMLEHGLSNSNPLRSALQQAARQLRQHSDYYLMHEHLEAVNAPCYFLEFAAAAQQAGLAYLADADPQSSIPSNYGSNVAVLHSALSADSPREMREQYLDFAVGRQFRKSLLVHSERADAILTTPEASAFKNMSFAACLKPAPKPTGSPTKERYYKTPLGAGVTTTDPTFIALVDILRQAWPQAVSFAALVDAVRPKAKKSLSSEELETLVLTHLVVVLNANALKYRFEAVGYDVPAAKPTWIPGLAQLQKLSSDDPLPVGLYNLWHTRIQLPRDETSQFIVRLIDGNTSIAEIRTRLRDELASGKLSHPSGKSVKRVRNLDSLAQSMVGDVIGGLREQGLLI
ncbi:methyltransferase regulatory domain-containing protein [Achromobacter sp. UBA4530]|uniref:methyltransferase regulatory domain-containing protein n=1 Tax=Achromobacter sp. UBA4530 TaxID=1945912 RepID=UPI002580984D|nr:class I SAM-dependent methyltransferase [Achromobacter sp. UBA4530]